MVKKNGQKRDKQSYKCKSCNYRWTIKGNHQKNYAKAYSQLLLYRRTMSELCIDLDVSYLKLIKEFDKLEEIADGLQVSVLKDGAKAINLEIDATFFGREYGFLVVHDTSRVIYFKEIVRESVISFREAIIAVKQAGYVIRSVTIDGKRDYINNIRRFLGPIPIQMYSQFFVF